MYIKVKNRFSVENVFFWEISKNAICFGQKPRKILTKIVFAFLRFLEKKYRKKNKINKKK